MRSSAASFLTGVAFGGRCRRLRSASSPSRYHSFSRASVQSASAAACATSVFFDQPGGDRRPHLLIDRRRVFAAQAERFKEALTDRRDADAEFAHAVIDDGVADGWMLGRFVLDNLQRPDAGPLLAPGAQEQPAIAGRPEQGGACGRQVGLRVKIFGDPDRVLEDGGVDIVVRRQRRYRA